MCQRVQKIDGVVDRYGRSKFSCNWMPNRREAPIIRCVQPQKLK